LTGDGITIGDMASMSTDSIVLMAIMSAVMTLGSRGQIPIPVLQKEERMFAEVNDFRCAFP